jgi:starch synthase
MKIAMVASESNPLVKSGGLADVIYSLSRELVGMGHEVMILIPYYKGVDSRLLKKPEYRGNYVFNMSWRDCCAEVFETNIDGIRFVLVKNDRYFGRDNLYGYFDDGERFAFFDMAVRGILPMLDFKPDIIHTHDWQAAMMPVLIKTENKNDPFYAKTKYVLTIHNPAFKGMLDPAALDNLYNLPYLLYKDGSTEFEGRVSTLKAGIVYSDKITTVSPTHRDELLTEEGSFGLSGVLKSREYDFCGFVNGIDVAEFNPANDKLIAKEFSAKNTVSGKKENRAALLKASFLEDSGGPLFGLVSRLTFQKGIDLVYEIMPKLLQQGAMLAVLGSGEYGLEQAFEDLRRRYPRQVSVYIGYSNKRAHEIYAASDYFLMPSSFEPCGIGQLIAQRYGTIPVVRKTGGLADTILPYNRKNADVATGISFDDYDYGGIDYATNLAMELYKDQKNFKAVRKNCLVKDNSWKKSAELYLGVYKELVG